MTAAEPLFCDHNAGTPALPEVLAEFLRVERDAPGNPASSHASGRRARGVLEQARERIASALGVAANDVVFTSGGTEAANLAVSGLGDPDLPVLLAPIEHAAVLAPAERRGVRYWEVDPTGAAQVTAPNEAVGLLCLVHAQSELGTLQPVAACARLAASLGLPCFVDAAQSLGRESLAEPVQAGAVVALSPHKCGGLRGHGVLLGRDLAHGLRPLLRGGGQESGLRPGTQSPALAAANSLAIERAVVEQRSRADQVRKVRSSFVAALHEHGAAVTLLTPLENSITNTVMLCVEGVEGRSLLPALDLAGVHASHGSACSSGSPTPPRVLTAIGLEDERARRCVRFSFGLCDDVSFAREVAARVVAATTRLRKKK